MPIFVYLIILVIAALGVRYWSKRQTRKNLLATPLTDRQRAIVQQEVPLIRRLPAEYRGPLEGKINLFLNQVQFVGRGGLEVSEEMELSIAAQACLLVVNIDQWYKNLRTILIYPGAFKSHQKERSGYVVTERETVRTGESWLRGPVVLSWADSEQGVLDDRDGHNVVLHEFAHQIDNLSGHTDGAPLMNKGQSFAEWARVFIEAYERHVRAVERGHHTVIDPYGAEGHQEFFAVSVEVFFEKPQALKQAEPEVYAQLVELFRLDPAGWG